MGKWQRQPTTPPVRLPVILEAAEINTFLVDGRGGILKKESKVGDMGQEELPWRVKKVMER